MAVPSSSSSSSWCLAYFSGGRRNQCSAKVIPHPASIRNSLQLLWETSKEWPVPAENPVLVIATCVVLNGSGSVFVWVFFKSHWVMLEDSVCWEGQRRPAPCACLQKGLSLMVFLNSPSLLESVSSESSRAPGGSGGGSVLGSSLSNRGTAAGWRPGQFLAFY